MSDSLRPSNESTEILQNAVNSAQPGGDSHWFVPRPIVRFLKSKWDKFSVSVHNVPLPCVCCRAITTTPVGGNVHLKLKRKQWKKALNRIFYSDNYNYSFNSVIVVGIRSATINVFPDSFLDDKWLKYSGKLNILFNNRLLSLKIVWNCSSVILLDLSIAIISDKAVNLCEDIKFWANNVNAVYKSNTQDHDVYSLSFYYLIRWDREYLCFGSISGILQSNDPRMIGCHKLRVYYSD